MERPDTPDHRVRLEIVVAADCSTCAEARSIAADVQARFPTVQVELIELNGQRPVPCRVIATPTYLLDGRIISLGNPRREALMRAVACRQSSRARAARRGSCIRRT